MWRGSGRPGRSEQEQPGQQHHGGQADKRQVVGKVVVRPGPDLVEPEQLVLDDAVIQVEAAGPKQDPRRCLPQRARSGAPSLDQQYQPDDQRGGRAEMEDAVGDQSGGLAAR